jgi:TonB-dependent receptor
MNLSGIHQSKRVWILTLALAFLGQTKPAPAQGRTGAIGGTVTDPAGAILKGAQISIGSGGINVASDEQGLFYRTDLNPGKYTLTITYVGFSPFTTTVTVQAGQKTTVKAQLQLQSQSQSVIVTAPRAGGEAEAVNIERTAGNIVQVLPEKVIQSLPNANMADALGRLPSVTLERDEGEGKYVQVRGTEPRLTNATIDGVSIPAPESDVRQIKFDAIPADSVEVVEVNKTLQANMDGEGIGGSVNLVTKTASDTPDISLGILGGYTPIINGRGMTEEYGTFGRRFGASKKFGFLMNGTYDWNGRGIDDIEPVPDVATLSDGSTRTWFDAQDIREYQYFRSRWGLNGGADYRAGEGSDVFLKWFYSDFKNYGDRWVYSLTDNTPGIQLLNPDNSGCGTDASGATAGPCAGTPSFGGQRRAPDIGIGALILGGNHVLNTTWFNWRVSAARSFDRNASPSDSSFGSTLDTSTCQFDPSASTNRYLPQWSSACYAEAYNPANMVLGDISMDKGLTAQLNLAASGALGKRFHIGSHSATLEFGGEFRNAHKYADTYNIDLTANGTIPLNTFPNSLTNNNYYNGGAYKLGYNPSEETIAAYANAHPDQFTAVSTQGLDPSFFDLIEKVGSAYVMNTIDLSSHLRFYAGLRVEHTSDSVLNFSIGDQCTSTVCIAPNQFSGSYTTLLPSVSLTYAFGSNDDLRFVYSRGLSRPGYSDIAQALSWSVNGNGANRYSVSFGNANLKAEIGDDLDLLWDHYYVHSFGRFSAGVFYKHLGNPLITKTFQLVNYQPPGGPLGNYLATQPVNAGSAWITGFEASYIQRLAFLPPGWSGLGLSANYGFTASRTSEIPGRSDHPRLLRTSPNAFNISPTYDYGRVSIRVGLSYNQASIYDYQYADGTPGGVNGPLSDIYFYSHLQVDAQGSVYLTHGLSVVASGLNLNNEVFGFYQGSPQYMIQREYYQPTFALGFRWSPERER